MSPSKTPGTKEGFRIRFLPFDVTVEAAPDSTLLEAARAAGLPLNTACGGKGTCGKCVVQIMDGEYDARPSSSLPSRLLEEGYALSCLTRVKDHVTVGLPRFQEIIIRNVLSSRFLEEHKNTISGTFEIHPPVEKLEMDLPPPSLENNGSDLRRLEREIRKKRPIRELNCEYSALRKLAYAVREKEGKTTAVLFRSGETWTILDVEPAAPGKRICGLACDLGTTTVVLHIVDLESGEVLGTSSTLNPQVARGEDVISRIHYARKPGHLKELRDLIIGAVNHLIDKAVLASRVAAGDIYYASIAGNTTMAHLFLGLEPRYIREEPYVPTFNELPFFAARDLGLRTNPAARVTLAPAVGSYVGGDITAGLLFTPLYRDAEKISMFIDAGTNGELVVGNREWLMTCACSAGPAFEGSGIRCGMPAADGAIETISLEGSGRAVYQVVGKTRPKGLCGSGLVDLLAELFLHGYVDRQGKFNALKAGERLLHDAEGPAFLIEEGKNTFWGKDLVITERDIANLIRTKAAIFSACLLLLKKAGLTFDKIDAFYVAGGFGQSLNVHNAVLIGLLPDLERKKFSYLGNTSLLGAYLICLSDENRRLVVDIAEKMTYLELNTDPGYMDEYTGALFLPHTQIDLFPSVRQALQL
jgi:uncharacterized 2Fe-2S/4Fe-4S cluster protein (DUF4445 family)